MCCDGGSPSRIATTRPRSRSPTTRSGLNSMPQEVSSGSRCEDLSACICAIGLLGSAPERSGLGIWIDERQHASAVHERTGRWRTAPRAAGPSDAPAPARRCPRSTLVSVGLEGLHGVELLHLAVDHPRLARPAVCMSKSPCIGSDDSQPTTGFLALRQFVDQLGDVVLELLLELRVEERDRFLAIRGIGGRRGRDRAFRRSALDGEPCTPSSLARSSSSENGCGSMTLSVSLPLERDTSSSSSSRTRGCRDCLSSRNRRGRFLGEEQIRDSPAP